MHNHWLDATKKRLFKKIDDKGIKVWDNDGSLGDFIDSLTQEEKDFFLSYKIRDFLADPDDNAFGIEIIGT